MRIKLFLLILFQFVLSQVFTQNIQITDYGNPNEPSIMMDPNNPEILVAGSNLNFCYTSNDGGLTWDTKMLTSPYGVWGDPVIDVDTAGNFYFFHLSNTPGGNWIDRIVCQKSLDKGSSWSDGTYTGLNGAKEQDKQWSIVDRNNNNIYLTWTQFDNYGSSNSQDSSQILFSKSADQGETWSTPKRINKYAGDCIDSDNTVEGATPAIGPNGEIYVAWAGPKGIVFNRSLDQGETWLAKEIFVDAMPTGWDYNIPGILRANGLPVTKCDLSGGENHGTIYINWSDQRNGFTDTDIWLAKSTDGGDTWSAPIRVNDDEPGKHQFFTWMDIDQTNGNLFFVFYDRRAYGDNQTDVYLAISQDGGTSFFNRKISESPFLPYRDIFFGDYTNIVVHNNIVRPIWTRLHEGKLSLHTNVTPFDQLLTKVKEELNTELKSMAVYPNPANDISYVSFKLHERSTINLDIYDEKGTLIKNIINNDIMDYGKYVIPIPVNNLSLTAGMYFVKLSINETSKTVSTIVID